MNKIFTTSSIYYYTKNCYQNLHKNFKKTVGTFGMPSIFVTRNVPRQVEFSLSLLCNFFPFLFCSHPLRLLAFNAHCVSVTKQGLICNHHMYIGAGSSGCEFRAPFDIFNPQIGPINLSEFYFFGV